MGCIICKSSDIDLPQSITEIGERKEKWTVVKGMVIDMDEKISTEVKISDTL